VGASPAVLLLMALSASKAGYSRNSIEGNENANLKVAQEEGMRLEQEPTAHLAVMSKR
jgi:hypothetical protein